ncbi:MAG: hypothetical protein OEV66_06200 [Spirochaetia bacterium]|nr:hypothetical protein [Spirochaetia bacterium]
MKDLCHNIENDRVRAVSVNPVKLAPGLGAGYAAQGFRKAVPFYHSAPGCSFLSKVLLTQHFMEPVASAGSDIKETALIFGETLELQNSIQKFCEKSKPEIVFILSSSIPEIKGEEYTTILNYLKTKFSDIKFILVPAPDFQGGFSEGFADLVYRAIVELAESDGFSDKKINGQINFLPAPYMTVGDIDEFVEIAESFDLKTIVIPDLSSGPDGSREKYSGMSVQGTSLEHLILSGRSIATISAGESMKSAGEFLEKRHGVRHVHFNSITGLSASDDLIRQFMILSSRTEVPRRVKKYRARLKDLMVDTHLVLSNKNIAMALEADHVIAMKSILNEIGVFSEISVAPVVNAKNGNSENMIVGTLYDIEQKIESGSPVDALFAGTHGQELAKKYNVPLVRSGFPLTDRYGMNYNISIGYKGSIYLIRELANILVDKEKSCAWHLQQKME